MNNIPVAMYAAAAVIWVILGFLTGNIMYLLLAAVFFLLALNRKRRRDE